MVRIEELRGQKGNSVTEAMMETRRSYKGR